MKDFHDTKPRSVRNLLTQGHKNLIKKAVIDFHLLEGLPIITQNRAEEIEMEENEISQNGDLDQAIWQKVNTKATQLGLNLISLSTVKAFLHSPEIQNIYKSSDNWKKRHMKF